MSQPVMYQKQFRRRRSTSVPLWFVLGLPLALLLIVMIAVSLAMGSGL